MQEHPDIFSRTVGRSRIIGRRNAPASQRAAAPRSGTRPLAPRRGISFHPPSFSIGLVLGAVVVLVTGYLPELLNGTPAPEVRAGTQRPAGATDDLPVIFEFPTMLQNGQSSSAPESDRAGAEGSDPTEPTGQIPVVEREAVPATAALPNATTTGPAGASRQLLQAASFRSEAEAERLRAELLLLDLPASVGTVTVGSDQWYRVTVGPFEDPAATEAAKARLSERNLTAIPFRP